MLKRSFYYGFIIRTYAPNDHTASILQRCFGLIVSSIHGSLILLHYFRNRSPHQHQPYIHDIGVCGSCDKEVLSFFKEVIRVIILQVICGLHPCFSSSSHRKRVYHGACCICGTIISVSTATQYDNPRRKSRKVKTGGKAELLIIECG